MKKKARLIACKWIAVMFTLVMVMSLMPSALFASAYLSVQRTVAPEGGSFTYSNSAIKGVTKSNISCSPANMFDKANCYVSGQTLHYKVNSVYASNYYSQDRTGTITLKKNGYTQAVVTVNQKGIVLNVTALDISNSGVISGNGQDMTFQITSNQKVTANMTGEISGSYVLGTYGYSTTGTWTQRVTIQMPAFDYTPTATSVTSTSSYQNRNRAIGIVFTAGPKIVSKMYSQAPSGFMFGKATQSAPFGTVCYNGVRYKIRLTDKKHSGTGATFSDRFLIWYELVAACCFEGGEEYAAAVNGLGILSGITNAVDSSIRGGYISVVTNEDSTGRYAYIYGCDVRMETALKNVVPAQQSQSNGYKYELSESRKGNEDIDFCKFFVDSEGKLCQAVNYVSGDKVTKLSNGQNIKPCTISTGYPADRYSMTKSIIAPFYTSDDLKKILSDNGLLGSY